MQEMVYDDSRWVQRLQSMGCWNEAEARSRFEEAMRKKWLANKTKQEDEAKRKGIGVDGTHAQTTNKRETLFDAGQEQEKQKRSAAAAALEYPSRLADGFETLAIGVPTAKMPTINEPKQTLGSDPTAVRSEERRVGKECPV